MIYPWLEDLWARLRSQRDRTPHAVLFQGPEGIGKLSLAEHFAQSLLCESRDPERAPCGGCEGCRWYLAASHPDFRRIEPESLARSSAADESDETAKTGAKTSKPSIEIKVDQVRALDDFLNVGSHRAGLRVALVHPAEAMNPNAANALLKGLEEPPGKALFLLVSHRPARLLPTIRSRCVAVPVPLPGRAASQAWLEARGVGDAGNWLSYANGSPLRAMQLARDAGPSLERLRRALRDKDWDALCSINDRAQVEELVDLLQKHALDKALTTFCGRSRFGPADASSQGAAWVRYAREMGQLRRLASHPVNPRLFAEEVVGRMPEK